MQKPFFYTMDQLGYGNQSFHGDLVTVNANQKELVGSIWTKAINYASKPTISVEQSGNAWNAISSAK